MSEKHWVWVFHIKGQSSRQYPKDEVKEISRWPRENVVEVIMNDDTIHYYPVAELNSWHLLELVKRDPPVYTGRRGAY